MQVKCVLRPSPPPPQKKRMILPSDPSQLSPRGVSGKAAGSYLVSTGCELKQTRYFGSYVSKNIDAKPTRPALKYRSIWSSVDLCLKEGFRSRKASNKVNPSKVTERVGRTRELLHLRYL